MSTSPILDATVAAAHPPSPAMPYTPTSISNSAGHDTADEGTVDEGGTADSDDRWPATTQTFCSDAGAHDASASAVLDGGSTAVQLDGDDGEEEEEGKEPGDVLPPSPPLTPVGPDDGSSSSGGRGDEALGGAVEEETGVADAEAEAQWHPLGHARVTSTDRGTAHDAVASEEGGIVGSNGHLTSSSEDDEKGAAAPVQVAADAKPPSPPHPWELVDPPPQGTAGRKDTDGYSTLGSRRFDTLQSRSTIPKSSYYFGPPPSNAAYGTHPVGQIGVHHPREILRVERDYTGGELIQFAPIYPLELEGRITPTQFLESINAINELLISAHSLRHTLFDNILAVFSLQLSRLWVTSHYEKEMQRLQRLFDELNARVYNPVGLNMMWPRKVAFLFLEIEYY